jgi:hypothetical protein
MNKVKSKELIIEQLKRVPIIQLACEKAGIARASFYRWKIEDKKFMEAVEKAIAEGENFINDLSETQVIGMIKDRNFLAIQLWLKTHHPKYSNKVELTGHLNVKEEPLSSEQEKLVKKALELAGLLEDKQINKKL